MYYWELYLRGSVDASALATSVRARGLASSPSCARFGMDELRSKRITHTEGGLGLIEDGRDVHQHAEGGAAALAAPGERRQRAAACGCPRLAGRVEAVGAQRRAARAGAARTQRQARWLAHGGARPRLFAPRRQAAAVDHHVGPEVLRERHSQGVRHQISIIKQQRYSLTLGVPSISCGESAEISIQGSNHICFVQPA